MKKLSPWIFTESCAMRVIEGTNPDVVANRVAMIQKTPRIRIRDDSYGVSRGKYDDGTKFLERHWPESLDWAEAPFKGSSPTDDKSLEWCDNMLKAFGYQL